ncbi:MAG: helix-turn-helix domain-containing protein, partial [Clostridia bacterium]|nr:helix-turn-helix domain-containing protein [Clostridia bacterium]
DDIMFGERLKELAIERNLTQKQIALMLNVSQKAVSKWIRNQSEPTETNIRNAAIAFDVSTDFLLGLED